MTSTSRSTSRSVPSRSIRSAAPSSPALAAPFPQSPAPGPVDWERLVRSHSTVLRRFLSGRIRRLRSPIDSDAAEEVLQETWCRAFERAGSFMAEAPAHGEAVVRAFLVLVATRVLADRARWAGAVKRGTSASAFEAGAALGLGARARDPYWNPELHLLLREGRRDFARECVRITRRFHRIDLRQRNLRILRRALLEGWSSREIVHAERRQGRVLTSSSVDSMISRARHRFALAGWRLPERHHGGRRPVG